MNLCNVDNEVDGQIYLVPDSSKPQGSGYISVGMSVGTSKQIVIADLCIDTGADFTVCNTAFLKMYFGPNVLKHLIQPWRLPRLRSATGHSLQLLGLIEATLHLGEYILTLNVLVHEESVPVFLLGSDAFYGRIIIDRGMYLAFPEDKYPPIPIKYELVTKLVKAVTQSQISPRSSALIQVSVTDNARLTGKEILLTPIEDCPSGNIHTCKDTRNVLVSYETPVRNSVGVIDSQGNSFVLVENDTDDILTILPDFDCLQRLD